MALAWTVIGVLLVAILAAALVEHLLERGP